jgi:hypothetical protein
LATLVLEFGLLILLMLPFMNGYQGYISRNMMSALEFRRKIAPDDVGSIHNSYQPGRGVRRTEQLDPQSDTEFDSEAICLTG